MLRVVGRIVMLPLNLIAGIYLALMVIGALVDLSKRNA